MKKNYKIFIINKLMKKKYHNILSYSFILLCLTTYIFFQDHIYWNYITQTHIWIKLINSYSWYISRNSWQNIISSWWLLWTNTTNPSIVVSASTGSQFTLSWDIITTTWEWYGNYSNVTNVILNSWDTTKWIQSLFMRESEPYYSNILNIILDKTPPLPSNTLWPNNNDILSGIIFLSWTDSIDQGIGLSHYNVHFSLDPWFLWDIIITTSWNNLQIPSSNLPEWTIFRYIQAVDILWNTYSNNPNFFHNWNYSTIDNNWSSWGWWWGYWWSTWTITTWTTIIYPTISWNILSWEVILVSTWSQTITWEIIKEDTSIQFSPKNSLLWKLYWLNKQQRAFIQLPIEDSNTHNSATDEKPLNYIYDNLINVYYNELKPLWYTMNYISRWIIPIYYVIKTIQYLLTTIRLKKIL